MDFYRFNFLHLLSVEMQEAVVIEEEAAEQEAAIQEAAEQAEAEHAQRIAGRIDMYSQYEGEEFRKRYQMLKGTFDRLYELVKE